MNKQVALILLFAMVVIWPHPFRAQTPSGQETSEQKIVVGTSEVLLDAVVRDKKGRPLKDLQSSDFQISEDGVPQEVKSFRWAGNEAADKTSKTPATPSRITRRVLEDFSAGRIGAVSLVFDRLSTDSRIRARDAALSYVGRQLPEKLRRLRRPVPLAF